MLAATWRALTRWEEARRTDRVGLVGERRLARGVHMHGQAAARSASLGLALRLAWHHRKLFAIAVRSRDLHRSGRRAPSLRRVARAPSPRVFLSYRRDDTSGHAGRLYDLLAARYGGGQIFMDVDTIPLGSEFREAISGAVASCDVLIALIGHDWLEARDAAGHRRLDDRDDYVRREIESALEQGVVVVPTCVQGAQTPRAEDLPPSLAPLAGRQGFQLTDSGWQDDVERLLRRLEAEAEAQPEEVGAVAHGGPSHRGPRRPGRTLAAGALCVLAVGAATAVALTLGGGADDSRTAATPAETRLLELIPKRTRTNCQRPSQPEPGAAAGQSCGVATLSATYHLFPDSSTANTWFTESQVEHNVDPEDGDCARSDFRGLTNYSVKGRNAGRYFCFMDSKDQPSLFAIDRRKPVGLQAEVYHGSGQGAVDNLLRLWACCIRIQP
jgi:hypothetical protein